MPGLKRGPIQGALAWRFRFRVSAAFLAEAEHSAGDRAADSKAKDQPSLPPGSGLGCTALYIIFSPEPPADGSLASPSQTT
jgi:hypothetical protein